MKLSEIIEKNKPKITEVIQQTKNANEIDWSKVNRSTSDVYIPNQPTSDDRIFNLEENIKILESNIKVLETKIEELEKGN